MKQLDRNPPHWDLRDSPPPPTHGGQPTLKGEPAVRVTGDIGQGKKVKKCTRDDPMGARIRLQAPMGGGAPPDPFGSPRSLDVFLLKCPILSFFDSCFFRDPRDPPEYPRPLGWVLPGPPFPRGFKRGLFLTVFLHHAQSNHPNRRSCPFPHFLKKVVL